MVLAASSSLDSWISSLHCSRGEPAPFLTCKHASRGHRIVSNCVVPCHHSYWAPRGCAPPGTPGAMAGLPNLSGQGLSCARCVCVGVGVGVGVCASVLSPVLRSVAREDSQVHSASGAPPSHGCVQGGWGAPGVCRPPLSLPSFWLRGLRRDLCLPHPGGALGTGPATNHSHYHTSRICTTVACPRLKSDVEHHPPDQCG